YGPEAQNCITCATGNQEAMCVDRCPLGFYGNSSSLLCERCSANCEACESRDECVSCNTDTYQLYLFQECPAGTYYQTSDKECQECHQTCAYCEGPDPTQCLQCEKGLVLDPNTMMCGVTGDSDCPPRTFLQNNQFTCQACHRLCQSCEGPEPFDCQTCALPNYLHNGTCVSKCPAGTYSAHEEADGVELGFCMPCDHVCATCAGASPRDCLSCAPDLPTHTHTNVIHYSLVIKSLVNRKAPVFDKTVASQTSLKVVYLTRGQILRPDEMARLVGRGQQE
uniref:Growth factor receptor domain-containing protein n=1 Tax=Cyprinus carpio TaxID=7962 RepID=A0A8C1P646_CYPCA